jgi:predicted DCC family thiol-disulfide oxidoreductase YuxK
MHTETEKKIILFDGVCNLCNCSVQFVIRHDKQKQFIFGSLQSETGQALLKKFHLSQNTFNSFLLIEGDKIYLRSSAALRVVKYLGNGWNLLYAFNIVPKFIRDGVYNFISKNRYKWFGKKDACWVPTTELKSRFLD